MTTTSHNAPPSSNCFSSVLRRLLCSGGLPTHPSTDTPTTTHHLLKTNSSSSFKPQSPSPTRTTIPAGVVARLMGLDSFPNPTSTRSTRVSLGSIMRSKSVSSLDFLPNFEIIKPPQNHNSLHRRVRTSVSFREVPTFLEASQNHDLGNLGKHGKSKSEMGLAPNQEKFKNLKKGMQREQEQEKKKKKKMVNKKDQSQSQSMKVIKNNEEVSSVKLKYRKKRVVVDDAFQEEQKYKSRKRTYNHPLPKMVKHDRKVKKQWILKKRSESEYSEEYCMKVLVDVYRLTMEEINGGVWMHKKVDNNLQELSYEVGQEILQLLVYEMVDELCSSQ